MDAKAATRTCLGGAVSQRHRWLTLSGAEESQITAPPSFEFN